MAFPLCLQDTSAGVACGAIALTDERCYHCLVAYLGPDAENTILGLIQGGASRLLTNPLSKFMVLALAASDCHHY